MNRVLRALFLSTLTVLVACGGGSSGTTADTVPGHDVATGDTDAAQPADGVQPDTADVQDGDVGDTAAPAVHFVAPLDGATVSGSVAVEVSATDDHGVSRVEISVNGELKTTLSASPYTWTWDTSSLEGGPYVLTATAYDEAGNHAASDITVVVQGVCGEDGDCPPSSVAIITPVNGAKVCGTITLEATAADDKGLSKIVFYVDGVPLGADEDAPYQRDWNTGSVANGSHVVKAEAHDTTEQTAFTQITITVENGAGACDNLPNVKITKPEVQGASAFVNGLVSVEATASDDVGVTKVQFFVDNGMVSEDSSVPYKFDWNTNDFDEGAHTLKAIAHDTSGQTATDQIAVTIDRTAPTLDVTSPEEDGAYDHELPLAATATDSFGVARVEFVLQGPGDDQVATLTEAPYESIVDTSGWASGAYNAVVTATDKAGKTATVKRDFWIDRPPTVAFTSPYDGQTVAGSFQVKVNATDDLGLDEVALYVDGNWEGSFSTGGTLNWTPPFVFGPHTLKVTARDDRWQESTAQISVNVDWPFAVQPRICAPDCSDLVTMQDVSGTVGLQVDAEDDAGPVDFVDLYVDGAHQGVANADPFGFEWDSTTVGDGEHALRFVATGETGATGEKTVTVVVNNCDRDDDTYLATGDLCGGSDCDDTSKLVHPNAGDTVGDMVDQNCDGLDGIDGDQDGYASEASGGNDCDDGDPVFYPGAADVVGDGIDQNCDGADGVDADGDKHASTPSGGDDCNDASPTIFKGAPDVVGDGIDQNCDGTDGVDADGDKHATQGSGGDDCDDTNPTIYGGAEDTAGDGIDQNCDGVDGADADGDGHASMASGGDDCDDTNSLIYEGATDTAGDGIDQNCDGADGVDADGDNHASMASGGDDCDDTNSIIYEGATDLVKYCGSVGWLITPLASFGNGDEDYPSLEIDAQGHAHVALQKGYWLQYGTDASGVWDWTVVDFNAPTGYLTSLAVDPLGKAHISYLFDNSSNPNLIHDVYIMYATNVSGVWTKKQIAHIGQYVPPTSIAVDSAGAAHIVFGGPSSLMHATNASGAWNVDTIDSVGTGFSASSIAVDSSGSLYASYRAVVGSDVFIRYAANTDGNWKFATITSITSGTGTITSIAIDAKGIAHVGYYDPALQDAVYASNAGGKWTTTAVDVDGDVGLGVSIALDFHGAVHMSYLVRGGTYPFDQLKAVKHATNAGGSWQTETIETPNLNCYQFHTSLSLGSDGNAHVVYTISNQATRYAIGPCKEWASPLDENCDGVDGVDGDQDGFASIESGGADCNDNDGSIRPCADDLPGDGIDSNCDGTDNLSCDDCEACSVDVLSDGKCTHTAIAEGGACDDGDVCTYDETCVAGVCGGGAATICAEPDACMVFAACDTVKGCIYEPDQITNGDICNDGVCWQGECCVNPCDGKECGPESCGGTGTCGTCAANETCDQHGKCSIISWISLLGGTYSMGSPFYDDADQWPAHTVTLSAFEISNSEVTVAQYKACVADGGCTVTANGCAWGVYSSNEQHPINCVNWYQSQAFCEWAGARLCTEAEWEYAARSGGKDQWYPWGNTSASCFDFAVMINDNNNISGCGTGSAWAVCSKVAGNSIQGVCDLAGNVEEWVADWYGPYSSLAQTNPTGAASGSYRIKRGGDFNDYYTRLGARYRSSRQTPDISMFDTGVRCCRSVGP